VAIVTGAGRGIGRADALLLAQEGAAVVVNDAGVNPDGTGHQDGPAEQVVKEIEAGGGRAVANLDSVVDFATGGRLVEQALDVFGRLDILVNNAGILRDRMVFNMSEQEWDDVIGVHLKGTFNTTRAAAAVFRQQRSGRIVNTSSEAGTSYGVAGQSNYAAAKEGIVGFTRAMARDLGRYGVTCNAVRPRASTRLTVNPMMEEARRRRAEAQGGTVEDDESAEPIATMDPAAIASLVVYLCTDDARNVNGRDFFVAGNQIGLYSLPSTEADVFTTQPIWTVDGLAAVFQSTLGRTLGDS
jgi:NAD(P)-dependent dehydrogenase (short-subunit alcohol dehydrogenase family)